MGMASLQLWLLPKSQEYWHLIISRKTKEIKNILTFVVQVAKHSKDFRSRTLIKEALMENDFLKNLSQSQVMMMLGMMVVMMEMVMMLMENQN